MNKDNGSYELFKGCQMRSVHLFMKEISILIVFVFILQILTPVATVWAKDGGTSSSIAGVEITVKKQSEIEKILVEAITNWKNRPLIIEGQSGKIELSTQKVQFDIKETVRSYTKAIKKPWYKVWRSAPVVHLPLQVELGEDIEQELMAIPFFKVDETKEEVLNHARYLKTTEIIPVELPLEKEFMERNAFEIQEIYGDRASLTAYIEQLDGVVLAPNDTFSLLQELEDMTGATDYETRRFFASVLYSVVLQSNTKIIERHSQNTVPNYLRPGIEADISPRLNRDLKFQNMTHSPMLFHAKIEDDRLLIELYTLKGTENATYSVDETKIQSRTIYRLSADVKKGQKKTLQTGSDGYRVTVYQSVYDEVSGLMVDQKISNDFYPPVHKIIAVSSEAEKQDGSSTDGNHSSNDSAKNDGLNDSKDQTGNSNQNDPKDLEESEEDEQEEIIYDKGGNVIYDPNA